MWPSACVTAVAPNSWIGLSAPINWALCTCRQRLGMENSSDEVDAGARNAGPARAVGNGPQPYDQFLQVTVHAGRPVQRHGESAAADRVSLHDADFRPRDNDP